MEVFFLPLPPVRVQPVDKILPVFLNLSEGFTLHAGIPPCRPHHPLISVLDGNRDEPMFLQCADVGANLPFTDTEELGEITIGSVTTAFIIQAVDFDKEDFFHKRKLIRAPNLLRNPNPLEIPFWAWHEAHYSPTARNLPNQRGEKLSGLRDIPVHNGHLCFAPGQS